MLAQLALRMILALIQPPHQPAAHDWRDDVSDEERYDCDDSEDEEL